MELVVAVNATRTDTIAALARTARRNGWTTGTGSLDYYGLKFIRTEPGGHHSQVLVRVTGPNRIAEAQIEVNGLRQQLILPSARRIEDILSNISEASR